MRRRATIAPPPANIFAPPALVLVANANRAPVAAPAPCTGERDLDRWFTREILPLEPMLIRFLRRSWRDGSEIADLQQEAYIRVCEAARRARPLQVKSFLFLVVRNLMIDRLRQKNVVSIETMTDFEWMGVSDNEPTPEERVAARQELQLVQVALNDLPPRCRQVVVLRKVEGYSQRDVARRMGITEETVEHQLAKGLRILAEAVSRVRGARAARRDLPEMPVAPAKKACPKKAEKRVAELPDRGLRPDVGFVTKHVCAFAPLLQDVRQKTGRESSKNYSRTA